MSTRATLRKLLQDDAILRNGRYRLSAGGESWYYCDLKRVLLDPRGSALVAKAMLAKIGDADIDAVGGRAAGSIPISDAISTWGSLEGRPIPSFYVTDDSFSAAAALLDGYSRRVVIRRRRADDG